MGPEVMATGGTWRMVSASGLVLDVTTHPDSPVLAEFFAGYDRAFVLPDEKEDLDGFRACLELGHGTKRLKLLAAYGPHVETVAVAREAPDGPMIGGANVIAYPVEHPFGAQGAAQIRLVAGNLNYVFVNPADRGRGHVRRLVDAVAEQMSSLFAPPERRALTFIELNDPLVLSDEDYRLDSEVAGVDQFDRLAIWARLGAKVLDFPYVQPPLSVQQEADTGLIYAVLGATDDALDAQLLLTHLERFFGVSVLKGVDPWTVPVAAAQLKTLRDKAATGASIPLLDPTLAIASGRDQRQAGGAQPASFRELARAISDRTG